MILEKVLGARGGASEFNLLKTCIIHESFDIVVVTFWGANFLAQLVMQYDIIFDRINLIFSFFKSFFIQLPGCCLG